MGKDEFDNKVNEIAFPEKNNEVSLEKNEIKQEVKGVTEISVTEIVVDDSTGHKFTMQRQGNPYMWSRV